MGHHTPVSMTAHCEDVSQAVTRKQQEKGQPPNTASAVLQQPHSCTPRAHTRHSHPPPCCCQLCSLLGPVPLSASLPSAEHPSAVFVPVVQPHPDRRTLRSRCHRRLQGPITWVVPVALTMSRQPSQPPVVSPLSVAPSAVSAAPASPSLSPHSVVPSTTPTPAASPHMRSLLTPIPPAYRSFVAGAVGGTVAATVTCPLDVLKTRLQSSAAPALRSMTPWGLTAHIVRTEGLSALWKGLTPTVLGVGPARAINFAVYAKSKSVLDSLHVTGWQQHVAAAATAGVVTVSLTSPVWVIKTRLQLANLRADGWPAHTAPKYSGFLDAVRQTWAREGLRGMFRGVSASYLGVSEGVLQFALYERIKAVTARHMAARSPTGETPAPSPLLSLAQGAVAKLAASCVTYPHEVVRTRLREVGRFSGAGLWFTFRSIAKEEGVAALYGGLGVHLMRTVPNAAILFMCVEALSGI